MNKRKIAVIINRIIFTSGILSCFGLAYSIKSLWGLFWFIYGIILIILVIYTRFELDNYLTQKIGLK